MLQLSALDSVISMCSREQYSKSVSKETQAIKVAPSNELKKILAVVYPLNNENLHYLFDATRHSADEL